MFPQIIAEAPSIDASSPRPAGSATPAAFTSRTPLKALIGGVLIGVVVGGFVSPLAAKFSAPFQATDTAIAAPVQISSSAAARAAIQDARAATSNGPSPAAISADAVQSPVTLSNAGGEAAR